MANTCRALCRAALRGGGKAVDSSQNFNAEVKDLSAFVVKGVDEMHQVCLLQGWLGELILIVSRCLPGYIGDIVLSATMLAIMF